MNKPPKIELTYDQIEEMLREAFFENRVFDVEVWEDSQTYFNLLTLKATGVFK